MQVNITKYAMKSGLIMGVLFSLRFLLSLGNNFFMNLLSWIITAGILVATYRLTVEFRDKECKGYISYSRAFLFILLTFFYAALISSLVKFIYFQFINPEYLPEMLNQSLTLLEQMNFPIEDGFEETMQSLLKPASFSLQYIWLNMLGGVFVGLIMSSFIKREKSIFDDSSNN